MTQIGLDKYFWQCNMLLLIFRIGSDISFNYNSDKVVCEIKDICEEDNCIHATDVIVNGKHISEDVKYLLSCMKDIDFVYYD